MIRDSVSGDERRGKVTYRDDVAGHIRVVKLGGSLLDLADWTERLADWLALQPPATTVLIVGGGALADTIRRYDRQFALGEEAAHWLCIRALSLHAEMAASLLERRIENVLLVRDYGNIDEVPANGVAVLDPEPFLRGEEAGLAGMRLPHGWHVTTDSIAARVAECLRAAELVLLKSAPPPTDPTDPAAGYVDGHFAAAVRNVRRVRYVDLRTAATTTAG